MTNVRPPEEFIASRGLLATVRHHWGWLLGPIFVGLVTSVVAAYLIADVFESTATFRYQSQADGFAFENELTARMNAALTRLELKTVITSNSLYNNELKRLPVEDVIENMRHKISFGRIIRSHTDKIQSAVFPISLAYEDRFKAQKALKEIAAYMVVDNLRATYGTSTAANADAPSKEALEGARKDLDEAENLITEFREKNAGKLPEQMSANQEMMSSLRTGLARIQSLIAQSTREQASLQALLAAEVEKRRNVKLYIDPPAAETAVEDPRLAALDTQIQALEEKIKELKTQYTEKFPDVIQARKDLAKFKTERDAIAREQAAKSGGAKPVVDADASARAAAMDAEIKRLQAQMESKAAESDRLSKEAADLDRNYQEAQKKFDGSSELEKQYADRMKDRDIAKGRYDEEEIRYQAALQSAPAGVGQRGPMSAASLEIIDPATLPVVPIEPNREVLVAGGLGLGLLVGLIAVTVRAATAGHGLHHHGDETRSGSPWIAWVAAALGVAAMAASIAHYYTTKT